MLGLARKNKFILFSYFKKKPATHPLHLSTQQSLLTILFFAFMATAIIGPIASETMLPNLADYLSHLASIIQAKFALSEGQFPLRVMPLEQSGWRYPLYQFTAPTTYTFAGLLYRWLGNPLVALKSTIWCGLVVGGFYMHRLTYWLLKSQPAAYLAGVVYLCAPYYIIIITQIGSLNEIVALGLVPMVVYYNIQRYYHPTDNTTLIKLGLAWYLLITVHIITFAYTSFFIALLLILISYKNRHHWTNLIRVGIAYALGCLLAMWFLAPVALMGKYFLIDNTYNNSDSLPLFHPLLSQLLFPAANLTHGYISIMMTVHPTIGWPILFGLALCLYGFINKFSSGSRRADYWLPSLLMIFAVAFILVWSPFNMWQYFPEPLLVAQYCWRLLGQVIWIGSLLFAWALCWLFKNQLDLRHVMIGTLLIALSVNPWFRQPESAGESLEKFIEKPYLTYNNNAYLVNFNKYPQFVGNIDSILIDTSTTLQNNFVYNIPISLVKLAINPTVEIFSKTPAQQNISLNALVNDTIVADHTFKPGEFTWTIPLSPSVKTDTTQISLQFKSKNNSTGHATSITLNQMLLTGFIKPDSLMGVKSVIPFCHQQHITTICTISPSNQTKLIELPILYYPNFLTVKINQHTVPYQSILYQGKLITAVPPQKKLNVITIQFTGLKWANLVSWGAWTIVLLLIMANTLQMVRKIKLKYSI